MKTKKASFIVSDALLSLEPLFLAWCTADAAASTARQELKAAVATLLEKNVAPERVARVITALGEKHRIPGYTVCRVLKSCGINRRNGGGGRKKADAAAPAADAAPAAAPAADAAPAAAPAADAAPAAAPVADAAAPVADAAASLPVNAPDAAAAIIRILAGLPKAKRTKAMATIQAWLAKN